MEHYDEHGTRITDADLERWTTDIENGNFSEFKDDGDVIYGELKPQNASKTIVSFQVPQSIEVQISAIAEMHNCSKSDLLRGYVVEGLAREEASV